MFGNLKRFFSGGNIPVEEPILPISTRIGKTLVVLHTNGDIEGDMDAVEHYLEVTPITAFAEDRIIFWLLLQYWRQKKELDEFHAQYEDEKEIHLPNLVMQNTYPSVMANVYPFTFDSNPLVEFDADKLKQGIVEIKPAKARAVETKKVPVKIKYEHIK